MITADKVRQVIEDAQSKMEDIEIEQRRFLKSCGWRYTCSTPGSFWMYEKTIPDGRTVLVDHLDTALRMEESLSPIPEPEIEEAV